MITSRTTLGARFMAIAIVTGPIAYAQAGDTKEDIKETGRDMGKGARKAGRKVKDKTCEMINGKLECAVQKVKHGAQNAGDEIKDKADDVKRD